MKIMCKRCEVMIKLIRKHLDLEYGTEKKGHPFLCKKDAVEFAKELKKIIISKPFKKPRRD